MGKGMTSLEAQRLWDELHDLFDTDDGSLPDIEIENLSPQGVGDIYHFLRSRSSLVGFNPHPLTGRACMWLKAEQRDVDVDSVPNAALLVADGTAEAFHIVAGGLTFLGATVPDLGVFVFSDAIVLDYRMGEAWGPLGLAALSECLRQIGQIAPSSVIGLPEGVPAEVRQRFAEALRHHWRSGAA